VLELHNHGKQGVWAVNKKTTDAVVLHLGHYEAMQLGLGLDTVDPDSTSRASRLLGQPGTFTLIFTPEED